MGLGGTSLGLVSGGEEILEGVVRVQTTNTVVLILFCLEMLYRSFTLSRYLH